MSYRDYKIKVYQDNVNEDLSSELRKAFTSTKVVGGNINRVDLNIDTNNHVELVEKIVHLTKDRKQPREYRTEREALAVSTAIAEVIKVTYLSLGYPLWGVKTKVVRNEEKEVYTINYHLDIDSSG
jgi:hypothetical protein